MPSPTTGSGRYGTPPLQRCGKRRKYNIDKFKKCGKIKADKGITVLNGCQNITLDNRYLLTERAVILLLQQRRILKLQSKE